MNWARLYLINAIMMPVLGAVSALSGYHDGNRLTAVCGVLIFLLSPVWIIHWLRAKKPTGL